MSITYVEAQTLVEHYLAGAPAGMTAGGLVTEAGYELMSLAPWRWAEAVEGTADFTEDEDSTALPAGFLRFSSTPRLSDGTQTRLLLVSVNRLETLREGGSSSGDPYWCAVLHALDADTGLVLPRLSLYPTPAADATPGLTFTYTQSWVAPAADDDLLQIPAFMDSLYREVLRAVARGYEDDLQNPIQKQLNLEGVRAGQTFRGAMQTDRSFQQSFGHVRGGVGSVYGYGAGHGLVTFDG